MSLFVLFVIASDSRVDGERKGSWLVMSLCPQRRTALYTSQPRTLTAQDLPTYRTYPMRKAGESRGITPSSYLRTCPRTCPSPPIRWSPRASDPSDPRPGPETRSVGDIITVSRGCCAALRARAGQDCDTRIVVEKVQSTVRGVLAFPLVRREEMRSALFSTGFLKRGRLVVYVCMYVSHIARGGHIRSDRVREESPVQ